MNHRYYRAHQWTNGERLDLLRICSDETIDKDWAKRSEAMMARYSATSLGFFFSAKNCHAEMERILSLPAPGIEPNVSGQYSFSHKILMEKWIEHFSKQIAGDQEKMAQESLIEVRKCSALLEKVLKDEMSLEEMAKLMERIQMENPKREDDVQYKRVVSTYANRLTDVWKTEGVKKLDVSQLAATNPPPEDQERGSGGFLTPTHQSATLSTSGLCSPIRSVAEALKDAVPIFVEPAPPAPKPVEVVKEEEIEEPPPSPVVATPPVTPMKEVEKVEEREVEEPPKQEMAVPVKVEVTPRPRGRPRLSNGPKVEKSPAPAKIEKSPAVPATPKEDKRDRLKRNQEIDTDMTSGSFRKPKKGRTSAAASPLPTAARSKKRDESEARRMAKEIKQEDDTLPLLMDNLGVECQTIVSIQPTRRSESEKRKSAGQAPLRKSSRRTESGSRASASESATPVHTTEEAGSGEKGMCSVGCQTGRVEFEKDDVVTMFYDPTAKIRSEFVNFESKKKETGESSSSTATETKTEEMEEVVEPIRRGSKSEAKREMTFVVDTHDAYADCLIKKYKYTQFHAVPDVAHGTPETPTKRARRDANAKEETPNIKNQLHFMWQQIHGYKHGSLFHYPITNNEVFGYDETVLNKIDLNTMKREIENGTIKTRTTFLLKAYNMLANAVMFNCTGHNVNENAKELIKDVMDDIIQHASDERVRFSNRRRTTQAAEETRSNRCQSIDPEPLKALGEPGKTRVTFHNGPHVKERNEEAKKKKEKEEAK